MFSYVWIVALKEERFKNKGKHIKIDDVNMHKHSTLTSLYELHGP